VVVKKEEDATILDVFPAGVASAEEEAGIGSVQVSEKIVDGRATEKRTAPVATLDASEFATAHTREPLAELGGEDHFILAWGRSNEAVRSRGRQLMASSVVNVALLVLVAYLVYRNEQKETLVFVRDSLGNVIQANAAGFMHAGDRRTEAEIKGFVRGWIMDGWSWTPLDVEDRLKGHLRLVDAKAQAVVKAGLRLAERRALVERGVSGRIYDDPAVGKEPQIVITRTSPLEVMVSFDGYRIAPDGTKTDAGHAFVRTHLKEVPRSSWNPNGLLVVDVEISEQL